MTAQRWRRAGLRAGLAVLTAASVGLAGCGSDEDGGADAAADGGGAAEDAWHGALVREPAPRPDFTLTDTEGRPYDFRAETAGRLTLLFFGYTSCPDVCPLHLATLAMALDEPDVPAPLVVFVTTDPGRDTPERLREWLDSFGDDIVGLTGTPEEVHRAEDAAMVEPSFFADRDGNPVAEPDADVNYEVGHAAQIVAYTSDDLTHIVYPSGIRSDDWAADLPRLADGWPDDT